MTRVQQNASEAELQQAERKRGLEVLSLLRRLRNNDTKALKSKVVKLLSEQPETRDSDLHLTVRIFEHFYPQYIKNGAIKLADLFKIPKQYDIQRLRAHVQNTLGLYQASVQVREARLKLQKKNHSKYSREANSSSSKTLNIFCDESGKTDKYSVVAAFCTVQIDGEPEFSLEGIKADLGIDSEVKFNQVKPKNREVYRDFFQLVLAHSEPWSARGLYLKNQQAARHSQDERVWKMLRFLLTDVIAREIETQRLRPPFRVRIIKDADPSQDAIRLKHYEEHLRSELRRVPETRGVELITVRAEDSKADPGLQAADLVAGAFSRRLNGDGSDSPKTQLANDVLTLLGYPANESGKDHVSLVDYRDARRSPTDLAKKIRLEQVKPRGA